MNTYDEMTDDALANILENESGVSDNAMYAAGQRIRALRKEIGVPPEGSHPDEAKPRAATWHEERQNWIKEVEALRQDLANLEQYVRDEHLRHP